MAVAGAPDFCEDHIVRIANASLEMLHSISLPNEFSQYFSNEIPFQIRIGIHCGPVVAGVVGQDRFVYDVYSDAVNTASRMESHGEAGRIHISKEFANSIENFTEFKIIPRGEIIIKGKGLMKTYWLEKAK